MAWLGRKKLAFIPLSRTNIQPPDVIPPDWPGQIMQRLFFDPATDPTTGLPIPGTDRSVRAYFHTVSSGLADLDVVVLPPQTIPEQDVPPDALEATMGAQLRSDGFVGAAIVMLGGPGAGSTVSVGNFGWSRFVMAEGLGVWVGELLHQGNLCDLRDLFVNAGNYPADENMGPFDQEAGYQATHLSAWTKRAVGWLDPSTVALHPGGVAEYILHSVSLIQPPPTGRIAAVQIGTKVPYLMVEARLKADQFDFNIPNEGVIVYRVQITDSSVEAQDATIPLALITKTALTSGQSITTDGATIDVGGAVLGGGFSVLVTTPEPGQSPWTTVAEGRSTPGAPVTAVLTGQNRIALFLADPNGGIYTISGFGESWGQWKTVAEGRSTPGAPVTAVLTGQNRIALFLADPNGGIYTISGFGESWGQWKTVAEGRSTPGGHVTAVLSGQNRIALFLADPNGGIYTISGFGESWGQWKTVAEGRSTPGAPVTAVLTGQNRIALFLADPNGGIYTISGFGESWGQWKTVAEGRSTPGAPVTAVLTGQNRIALFLADPNGGIYTISGFGESWGQWKTVAEGRSTPGGHVTAVLSGQNRIALFLADPNGGIYTISGFGESWGQWKTVAEGRSTPGGHVTAVLSGQNRIALFLADPNGGIYTSTKLLLS